MTIIAKVCIEIIILYVRLRRSRL
jgi:hypothetical protein